MIKPDARSPAFGVSAVGMALLPVLPVWPAPAPRWAAGVLRLAALEPATACALGLLAVLWFEGVKRVCRPAVMLRG